MSEKELGYDVDGNLKPRGPELLYHEYPKYYKFKNGKFHRRKNDSQWQIGRLHTAHPTQGQRWYLRILLTHVRGATGYVDLLTFKSDDGQTTTYNCFKKRCMAEGLLKDDKEWDAALKEASEWKSAPQLRRLFAMIVKECHPQNAKQLFDKYRNELIEDIEYEFQRTNQSRNVNNFQTPQNVKEKMYNSALHEICSILEQYNVDLSQHELIKPSKSDCFVMESREIMNERQYNLIECEQEYETRYRQMNSQQKLICDEILDSIYDENQNSSDGNLFFIDAPGGTVCFYFFFFFYLID